LRKILIYLVVLLFGVATASAFFVNETIIATGSEDNEGSSFTEIVRIRYDTFWSIATSAGNSGFRQNSNDDTMHFENFTISELGTINNVTLLASWTDDGEGYGCSGGG